MNMLRSLLVTLALCLTAYGAMPHLKSQEPGFSGYMGLAFEYDPQGGLVGVNFVPNGWTPKEQLCAAANSQAVADSYSEKAVPNGHRMLTVCLHLVQPANGRKTLIAVVNKSVGFGEIAVAVEYQDGPNPIFGAQVLGQSKDEHSCISTGRDTIRSSVKAGKVRHPLTIMCVAVPAPHLKHVSGNAVSTV